MLEFVSLRELRNTPGALWRKLRGGDPIAITSAGRPRALVIGLDEEDLVATIRLLERLRAQQAVSRLRAAATAKGTSSLDAAAIQAEIEAVRRARSRP